MVFEINIELKEEL